MDRRVTPPKRVTLPTWGPPPPCKQALSKNPAVLYFCLAKSLLCVRLRLIIYISVFGKNCLKKVKVKQPYFTSITGDSN